MFFLAGNLKLLLFVLFAGLFYQIYCPDAHAEDKARSEAHSVSPEYRQQLERVVVVEEEYFPQELDSYLRFMPSQGADAQSGKVSVTESASEYSYEIKAFGKLPVEFAVGTRYIGINNTTLVKLPAHLTEAAIGMETVLPFFNVDKTYFTIGLAPSFFTDNWNFHASSFRLSQRYFFIYQADEKLAFVCGVEVIPDFEDPVSPILGFIYKPNERLAFNITPDRPEISYVLNNKLTVLLEGDRQTREFEVSKDGIKNTVLKYNEMHLGAGLRYKPNKHIKSSLTAGSVFSRSIKYRDDSLGKVGIKNGLYVELRVDMVI
ncbi:hypothetical protein D4R78_01690 [bacterium]|nr:MAG: hypothetical protein D4R78_01690 [bacterium]